MIYAPTIGDDIAVYKVVGNTGYDARDLCQMDEDREIVLWIKKTISNKEGLEEKKRVWHD